MFMSYADSASHTSKILTLHKKGILKIINAYWETNLQNETECEKISTA